MAVEPLNTDSTLLNKSKNVFWYWKPNSDPWNEDERKEWKQYSDFEDELIEDAFQNQEKAVQLSDYAINFQYSMAFQKDDRNQQRLVKREEGEIRNKTRKERFAYPERAVQSFDKTYEQQNNFVWQWRKKNEDIASSGHYNYPAIAKRAAEGKSNCCKILRIFKYDFTALCFTGILEEGHRLNENFDAQRMATMLISAKSEEEICKCAAQIYSAESFLYKLINSSLRNHDMSKTDTLGAFCHLLWRYLYSNNNSREQIVYRGSTLTDEMIDEYKKAVGTEISWPAFTSTSKDQQVADFYSGNAYFVISLEDTKKERSDISSISYHPDEQEILLPQHSSFKVDKVEYNTTNKKYLIYLKALA